MDFKEETATYVIPPSSQKDWFTGPSLGETVLLGSVGIVKKALAKITGRWVKRNELPIVIAPNKTFYIVLENCIVRMKEVAPFKLIDIKLADRWISIDYREIK